MKVEAERVARAARKADDSVFSTSQARSKGLLDFQGIVITARWV